jgi:hypothetical protein
VRLPFERERMGLDRTRNGIKRTGLLLKILLITAHEWLMRIGDTVPNDNEHNLQFTIGHYCSQA